MEIGPPGTNRVGEEENKPFWPGSSLRRQNDKHIARD
jgi:hypothetical protein